MLKLSRIDSGAITSGELRDQESSPFPLEFDAATYGAKYVDLRKQSPRNLWYHYRRYGRSEGRAANRLENRQDFSDLIPKDRKTMEIGPFANPVLSGEQVDYADYLCQADLIKRASEIGIDGTRIPHIKYVLGQTNLKDINVNYDSVFSSHCIEHQLDLIAHLIQVQHLIERNKGRYFLIIPDKRFCFDKQMAISTISEVIDAHEHPRSEHSLARVIEHRAMTVHNDSAVHWQEREVNRPLKVELDRIAPAILEWRKALNEGAYLDVHAWCFTPDSFVQLIDALNQLGYIRLKIERLYPTRCNACEFWVILQSD